MWNHREFLENKIEENLFEFFAKDIESARDFEIYLAVAKTLRLLIGRNWHQSLQKIKNNKTLYILSFEYSLGTRLVSNAIKLNIYEDIVDILAERNRDFNKICDQEIESQLGFGELGVISSAMLDALSNLGESAYAYGLRYRKGMLKQEIVNGQQVEKPDDWKGYKNPWEHEKSFNHKVKMNKDTFKAIPYDVPIIGYKNKNVITLRLWKSESVNDIDFKLFSQGKIQESYKDINKANSIVEFLYPQEDTLEGRKLRLSQEYFFARATIQDILKKYTKYANDDMKNIDKHITIQINDIHPILATVLFIDILVKKYQLSIDEACRICKNTFIYANTSLLQENFEKLEISLIKEVCPDILDTLNYIDKKCNDYLKSKGLDKHKIEALSIKRNSFIEAINLISFLARKIYVIGDQHSELLQNIYLPYQYEVYSDKIEDLVLGFNSKVFLEQSNRELYDGIISPLDDITMKNIDSINDEFLMVNKQVKKDLLIKYLDSKGEMINPNSIFVMNLGVIHEYERQLLSALSVSMLYFKLKQNSNLDIPQRTYFFGGKSYPNYYFAKEIIKFINALANLINNDVSIKDKIKIVFIEDFNMKKANILIPAADICEQLSLTTIGSVDIESLKYMVNGAVMITTKNALSKSFMNEENKDSISVFGPDATELVSSLKQKDYYAYDYLIDHKDLQNMFDFYKYQPFSKFPYDIKVIFDNLFRYNDGFMVIRDLLDYYNQHMKLTKSYMNQNMWNKKIKNNINFALNHSMNDAIKTNLNNYWR